MSIAAHRRSGLFAAALLSQGCVTVHEVTPWLRTTTDHPVDIIAESGSNLRHRTTEELYDGKWVVLTTNAEAMPVHGGKLAVYRGDHGFVLLSESGHTRPIDCDGTLRESPDARFLDCLEFPSFHRGLDPFDVVWRRYEERSMAVDTRKVSLDGDAIAKDFGASFIGFSRIGAPLLTFQTDLDTAPHNARCEVFEVSTRGLTSLESGVSTEDNQCFDPRFWRGTKLEIATGSVPEEP